MSLQTRPGDRTSSHLHLHLLVPSCHSSIALVLLWNLTLVVFPQMQKRKRHHPAPAIAPSREVQVCIHPGKELGTMPGKDGNISIQTHSQKQEASSYLRVCQDVIVYAERLAAGQRSQRGAAQDQERRERLGWSLHGFSFPLPCVSSIAAIVLSCLLSCSFASDSFVGREIDVRIACCARVGSEEVFDEKIIRDGGSNHWIGEDGASSGRRSAGVSTLLAGVALPARAAV